MEKAKLGTVIYLDGIRCHLGMVGGYTKDEWGDDAYLLSSVVIDGDLALNNEGEDEDFIYPMDCCSEATQEDAQKYLNKLMNK